MKEKIRRVIYIFLLLLVIIGVFSLVQSKFFYINKLEIKGTNETLKKDIVSKLYDFKGKPIINVNKGILEEEILKDARVKNVNVIKKYPNKLIIELEERKPCAYIIKNDKLFVIDEDMNIFSTYDEISKIMPIITYNDKNYQDILNILKELLKSKLYPLTSEIYEASDKFIIVLEDGVNVYVKKDVNKKILNQGYIVYNKEKSQNNSMEYIDLRFELISVK